MYLCEGSNIYTDLSEAVEDGGVSIGRVLASVAWGRGAHAAVLADEEYCPRPVTVSFTQLS